MKAIIIRGKRFLIGTSTMCGSRKQSRKGFFKVCICKHELSFLLSCIDKTTLTDDTQEYLNNFFYKKYKTFRNITSFKIRLRFP